MSDLPLDLADTRWRAAEMLGRRRFAAARELLGPALRNHPNDPGLLYESARADFLQDRHADARNLLEQLLHRDPSDADARQLLFWVASEQTEWVEAEQLALGLLRDYPQSPDCWAAYAHLMLRCLMFDKAAALVREALHLDAHHPFALRLQVLCDLVAGKGDGQALRKLLTEHPDDMQTLQLVVLSLARKGRSAQALGLARELLRIQPDDAHLLHQLRELAFLNHWSMVPLRPLQRFGWGGSAALWLAAVLLGRVVDARWPHLSFTYHASWIGYAAYSWVWPPLLKRWLAR